MAEITEARKIRQAIWMLNWLDASKRLKKAGL